MNKKFILILFTISLVGGLGFLPKLTPACTTLDTNSLNATYQQQIWSNCSVDVAVTTNGINILSNTAVWNVPNFWFFMWVAFAVSMAVFFGFQDRSWGRWNTSTFVSLIAALVMRQFSLVNWGTVVIAVSAFGVALIASLFLHSNR